MIQGNLFKWVLLTGWVQFDLLSRSLKGQLISKCLLGVIVSTKKSTKFFLRISALASKMRLNQQLYNTKYVKQPLGPN